MSGGVAQRRGGWMWWGCSLLVICLVALFVRPFGKGTSGVDIQNRGSVGLRIGTEDHALMLVVHPGKESVMTADDMKVSIVDWRLRGKASKGTPIYLMLANSGDVRMWHFLL